MQINYSDLSQDLSARSYMFTWLVPKANEHSENFPENLTLADVTPIFKKKDKTLFENYRPVAST